MQATRLVIRMLTTTQNISYCQNPFSERDQNPRMRHFNQKAFQFYPFFKNKQSNKILYQTFSWCFFECSAPESWWLLFSFFLSLSLSLLRSLCRCLCFLCSLSFSLSLSLCFLCFFSLSLDSLLDFAAIVGTPFSDYKHQKLQFSILLHNWQKQINIKVNKQTMAMWTLSHGDRNGKGRSTK